MLDWDARVTGDVELCVHAAVRARDVLAGGALVKLNVAVAIAAAALG